MSRDRLWYRAAGSVRRTIFSQPGFCLGTLLVLGGSTLAWPGPAGAAEATRVVSGGEQDNPYDLNLTLGFRSSLRQAVLKREPFCHSMVLSM